MPIDFEATKRELEASLVSNQPKVVEDIGTQLSKAISSAIAGVLNKGANPTTDLKAELGEKKIDSDAGKDPAETPVKSGQGYKDSKKYVARGEDMDEDDEDGDSDKDEDDEDSDEKPKYFQKKKCMNKASSLEDNEEQVADVSDFIGGLSSAVEDMGEGIAKSINLLVKSMKNDEKRDELVNTLAKAVAYLVPKVDALEKAFKDTANLQKSILSMPGMPRVAGTNITVQENHSEAHLSPSDKALLQKAVMEKKITLEQFINCKKSGDASILKSL